MLGICSREHRRQRDGRGWRKAPIWFRRLMMSPWAGRKREVTMVRVIDQQLDKALRLLKRQLSKDGTWRELKARAFYEKPSVKKRRRQRAVRRRLLKLEKLSAE